MTEDLAPAPRPMHLLCISDSLFGRPFLLEAARLGHEVWLLTSKKGLDDPWPRDVLQDVFAVPKLSEEATFDTVRKVVSYLHRTIRFDRIVAFTDWTMELGARLREHLRSPGMGETTSRYFRDKLAMRLKAREDGIPVPDFVALHAYPDIDAYLDRTPGPWIVKPRMQSASLGMKVIRQRDELRGVMEEMGDDMSFHLLEKYVAGDVFHVDSVVSEREVVFASCSRYGTPMLDLKRSGGVYTTLQIPRGSQDEVALRELNREVMASLGLVRGVTHVEYIKSREDGRFYFLEAASRVGAARIPDVIFHATGVCLWHEWARIECLARPADYRAPTPGSLYAGTVMSLARDEAPDLSVFDAPEVCFRQSRKHLAGVIVKSPFQERVTELVAEYAARFARDITIHRPEA